MKLFGHLGVALLVLLPVRYLLRDRDELEFALLGLGAAMLPDVDLVLPIEHHGVTHTFLFVGAVALAVGALAAVALRRFWSRIGRWEDRPLSRRDVFLFTASAVFAGGASHLVVDVFAAQDIAQTVRPFWPLFVEPISFEMVYYSNSVVNFGLFFAGVALHVALTFAGERNRWRTLTDR